MSPSVIFRAVYFLLFAKIRNYKNLLPGNFIFNSLCPVYLPSLLCKRPNHLEHLSTLYEDGSTSPIFSTHVTQVKYLLGGFTSVAVLNFAAPPV